MFARGDGSTESATSIRGESYEYVTNGVYAYNAERVVAEGVGWDIFTLFVVVPGLFFAAWLVAKGLLKGRLFALGLLAYTLLPVSDVRDDVGARPPVPAVDSALRGKSGRHRVAGVRMCRYPSWRAP